MSTEPKETPTVYQAAVDRAAAALVEVIRPQLKEAADGLHASARDLVKAWLHMPGGISTQTETVGPYFPEGEEAPDVPDGTDVRRLVGPWVPINSSAGDFPPNDKDYQ